MRTVWYTIGALSIVGAGIFLHHNTHLDHCKPVIEGRQCEVVWGHR